MVDLHEAAAQAASNQEWEWEQSGGGAAHDDDLAHQAAEKRGIKPDPDLVLTEDPREMPLARAVRYILSIPTNVHLIVSSSLGYFYFSGLSTFALLFVKGHYHVNQATAEVVLAALVGGAMIGTLVSGKITDTMVRRGFVEARVWVPALCYLGAAALLIPGLLGKHLTPALWFDVAGASLISAANPPLDAARLDIMPAGLWGRAESVRTFLRSLAQALAPLVFGGLSQLIAGIVPAQAPIGTHTGRRVAERGPGARDQLPDPALDAVRGGRVPGPGALHLRAGCRHGRRVAAGSDAQPGAPAPATRRVRRRWRMSRVRDRRPRRPAGSPRR